MKALIPIDKLSAQMGLTSRTLRHWESEGLFCSTRDSDSGWRAYDETAVFSIRITALLRQLDVPIKDVKAVLVSKTCDCLSSVIQRQISVLKACNRENADKEQRLMRFLSSFETQENQAISDSFISTLLTNLQSFNPLENEKEDFIMSTTQQNNSLQYVTLPPMRAAGFMSVGVSPEDDAMNPVLEWVESAGLTGTARFFGGNLPPMPSGEGKPYGYGMSAAIPENVTVPEHLHEMRFPGGVYARLESTDDIAGSWKKLKKMLSTDDTYTSDRSRYNFCFEEHTRDDNGGFIITLLEPVKEKQ